MPGLPFLQASDTYQGVEGEGLRGGVAATVTTPTAFLLWLVLIGVIVPVLILGGLRAGGFQSVYRRR
jgi:hypothetical protein